MTPQTASRLHAILTEIGLDPSLVGEQISSGRQHWIYAYGDEEVLKVPRSMTYTGFSGGVPFQNIIHDLEILSRYLKRFIPRTIVYYCSGSRYVIRQQRYTNPEFITHANLAEVRQQLQELLRQNKKIKQKYSLSIDFFGQYGMKETLRGLLAGDEKRACLSNLVIVRGSRGPRVKIIDINLSELVPRPFSGVSLSRWVVDRISYELNKLLLRLAFNINA